MFETEVSRILKLGIRADEWTNYDRIRSIEQTEHTSRLRAFILMTSTRLVGMRLLQTAWVKLNRLRTVVGEFHSSMCNWGVASLPNCECGAPKQTADEVSSACLIH